jgi:hypothetical protein
VFYNVLFLLVMFYDVAFLLVVFYDVSFLLVVFYEVSFLFVVFHDVATPACTISVFLSSCSTFAVMHMLHGTRPGMCVLLRACDPTLMFAFHANMVCIFPDTPHVQYTRTVQSTHFHLCHGCIPQHLPTHLR